MVERDTYLFMYFKFIFCGGRWGDWWMSPNLHLLIHIFHIMLLSFSNLNLLYPTTTNMTLSHPDIFYPILNGHTSVISVFSMVISVYHDTGNTGHRVPKPSWPRVFDTKLAALRPSEETGPGEWLPVRRLRSKLSYSRFAFAACVLHR